VLNNWILSTAFRGVSSTVKLPVSKTGLGGSNPSAPARVYGPKGGSRRKAGKEVRSMASIAEQNAIVTTVKSWPERIRVFYNDVRTEMRKVTAPTLKEVRATTTVVVITVFLFGLYFAIIDYFIQRGVSYLFNYFKVH
jgi:preprotein translocase subunit SecE